MNSHKVIVPYIEERVSSLPGLRVQSICGSF